MTTIITRLYAQKATALTVAATLLDRGHDPDTIDILTRDDAAGAMAAAMVADDAAAAYGAALSGDKALIVVRAPFAPMGRAREAMQICDAHPSLKAGVADENRYVRVQPDVVVRGSVMTSHPFIMSNKFRRLGHDHILGSNPISPSKPRTSAMRGGGHMSKMFWPMRLVSAEAKKGSSAIRGGWLVSRSFGLPMLIGRIETGVNSILR